MTLRRIAVPAFVAWLVDSVYGYVVFGLLLSSDFAQYPSVFRSFEAVSSMMPMMLASSLVAFVAVAYIFAKGHDGGPGLKEGFWFGIVLGAYVTFGVSIPSYVIYSYGQALALKIILCAFLEMVLAGVVLGLVYKPAPAAAAVARAR
jgi:hypothetical protein